MKVLALCALLALARSETIIVGVVNYAAMYDNECATTTVAPVAGDAVLNVDNAANDNNAANDDTSDVAGADIEMSDTSNGEGYAQKYENKYAKKYENKYEKKYEGVGSVPGNENGGDTDKNPEATQQSTFCKCLAKVKKTGKSYAESQNDFSKCIDKANGNDAEHWEKVAKEYEHKFGYKTDDTWNLKQTDIEGAADAAVDAVDNEEKSVVDKAKEEESEVVKDAVEEVQNVEKSVAAIDNEEDNTDNTDNTDNADNTDNTDKTDNVEDVDNADNVDVEKKEDVEVQDVDGVDKTDKEDTEDVDIQAPLPQNVGGDDKFGNAAIYIAFIGASVLLFICAWAIKNGFKKWKMREYENVKQMSDYKSEQDADNNGDIYSDWDDNYDQNYRRNQQDKGKKGRFSGWNQYSSV